MTSSAYLALEVYQTAALLGAEAAVRLPCAPLEGLGRVSSDSGYNE